MGHPNAPFDPASAVGDPEQLVRCVQEFQDALANRSKLDGWLQTMLKSAGLAPVAAAAYIIGASIGTAYYARWWEWRATLITACMLVSGGIVLGVVVAAIHFYCDRKLVSAEITSNQASK